MAEARKRPEEGWAEARKRPEESWAEARKRPEESWAEARERPEGSWAEARKRPEAGWAEAEMERACSKRGRRAAKTGRFKFKLNEKEHPFEKNVRQGVTVDLVGSLDNYGNCEVGVFKFNGVTLKNHMATAIYEIYVRQEWARANDLTDTIKLSEYLMGTTTDRALVDSGEGTYVWEHSKDVCPDTLVSLYRGRNKVLTNSTASFTDGTAIVSGEICDFQGFQPKVRTASI